MVQTLRQAGHACDGYISFDARNGSTARLAADPLINIVVVDALALDPLENGPPLAELRRCSPYRNALQFVAIGEPLHLDRVLRWQASEVAQVLPKPVDRQVLIRSIYWASRRQSALRSISGTAPLEAPSQRLARVCRELPFDLQILNLVRQLDEQRLAALEGVVEPDATWNMLAELLRARITGQRISGTSLCLASKGPVTSALRRVERLLNDGLIVCTLDPTDRRRKYVELTAEGAQRMKAAMNVISQVWIPNRPPRT